MKITRVYNEYVFQRLGQDLKIVAVDFKKGLFTDLNTQTVGAIQIMLKNENVWFFQLEPAELGRTYTETDIPIEGESDAEEILNILLGGAE